MNFFFCINNNAFVPICYPPTPNPEALNSNCSLFYQSLASASQLQRLPSIEKLSDIQTNNTGQLSLVRTESQRKPKKRQKNYEREQVSAKKNGESNIINSYFSFILSKSHSQQFLRRVTRTLIKKQSETQKVISIIYNIMRIINLKRAKRYINKAILCDYFAEDKLQEMFGTVQALSITTFRNLSSLLRRCFFYYLNQTSLTSILTSKRIPLHSKNIHLRKRRRMLLFVTQQQEKVI